MDRQELIKTAQLAMVELSDEEAVALSEQVSAMLENFALMADVDVSNIDPTTHPQAAGKQLRPDSVEQQPVSVNEALLKEAPDREGRFYLIPGVL